MSVDHGERVRNARKRSGLTQREAALAAGISLSQLKKIETGEYSPRLETLRALAVALGVKTTDLQEGRDAEYADDDTEAVWEPVRRALVGYGPDADEPATPEGVRAAFDSIRSMIGTNRYKEIAALLPSLLRDANSLEEGRQIRARVLNMTGWMLTQTRQFDVAEMVLDRAMDAAVDQLDAAAAINTLTWSYLRQGRLDEARRAAIQWADRIEPRFSRASAAELAAWGRLWLNVANAAVRNNSPGEAEDAMSLARSASARIGREVYSDTSTVRTFGPVTVAHIGAESQAIAGQPDKALAIASNTPLATLQPTGANRLRHRLDVANAYTQLGCYGDALAEIERTWAVAPEWVPQQRYARDIVGNIVTKRRTLTPEIRDLADRVRLEY